MPTITPEFPYSYDREDNKCVKIANIGEAADRHIQTIRDYVVQARKDMDEIKKMDDPERRAIMTEIKIFGMNLSNVLATETNLASIGKHSPMPSRTATISNLI